MMVKQPCVCYVLLLQLFPLGTIGTTTSVPPFAVSKDSSEDRRKCNGPFHHHIKEHVYHIAAKDATTGITNKDAADTLGDLAFIFGSKAIPEPRGVEQYYDGGIIEMVHVSVSSWGDYLQCNHADKSTVYSCKCPKDHTSKCDMERPGKEENAHTNGHVWYSFPHAGQGKYWDYEHYSTKRGCRRIAIKASCAIDNLAKAAGCPGKCSVKTASECVKCVHKLSDKEQEKVWDAAIFDNGCEDLNYGKTCNCKPKCECAAKHCSNHFPMCYAEKACNAALQCLEKCPCTYHPHSSCETKCLKLADKSQITKTISSCVWKNCQIGTQAWSSWASGTQVHGNATQDVSYLAEAIVV